MNAKQRNDIVEAVSGIVGAIALVGLVALVYTGHTTFDQAAPIIIGIVSAAGVYESGRRRGKKAQALEAVFDMVEEIASGNSSQSSSESSQSGSAASSSTSSSGTSGNDGGSDGFEYSGDDLGVSATDDAMSMVATTPYSDLQRIGGRLDGVNGSGNGGRPLRQQLEAVAEKEPERIVDAYDAVMNGNDVYSNDSDYKK